MSDIPPGSDIEGQTSVLGGNPDLFGGWSEQQLLTPRRHWSKENGGLGKTAALFNHLW